MLFAITCIDKPNSLDLRMANRPTHLDYLNSFLSKITIAGPLLDDAGEKPVGSLLVMEFADRNAAESFAAGDPYAKAGLFQSVSIRPYRKVLP
ncbi:MAG: YciI family protein [Niveispirillum sp.]|uniref:YciI family protein n=1 Tax=Niveispirillum sp. TaxID=1917217 RepID=UPI003BA63A30